MIRINTMDPKKGRDLFRRMKIMGRGPWAWTYQQVDIYGVNERVNWKARTDERLVVYDMTLKK
jgi:hypothetical protein